MRLPRPIAASLLVTLAARGALAQHVEPPRACTHTAPAEIATTAAPPIVSAVMTESNGARLWVLYGDRDAAGHPTVTLLELSGLDGRELRIDTHAVGEGRALAHGLAVVGDTIVAAWVPSRGNNVGVLLHPIAGGADVTASLPSIGSPRALAVGAVRARPFVAWTDGAAEVQYATLGPTGAPRGRVRTVRASGVGALDVSSRLGGVVLLDGRHTPATLGWIRVGTATVAPTPGPRGLGAIEAFAAGTVGTHAAVLIEGDGQARLAVLAPPGRGVPRGARIMGSVTAGAEAALGAAGWGALAAWTDAGAVRVVPMGFDGTPGGEAFAVAEGANARRAGTPSVAAPLSAGSDRAMVLWGGANARGGGVVRMVRVICH